MRKCKLTTDSELESDWILLLRPNYKDLKKDYKNGLL